MLLAGQEKVACRLFVLPVITFTSSGVSSPWASSDSTNNIAPLPLRGSSQTGRSVWLCRTCSCDYSMSCRIKTITTSSIGSLPLLCPFAGACRSVRLTTLVRRIISVLSGPLSPTTSSHSQILSLLRTPIPQYSGSSLLCHVYVIMSNYVSLQNQSMSMK